MLLIRVYNILENIIEISLNAEQNLT
jgi:hypothetical protein